eukprot:29570-Pelagococcus_subviridis.AAC.10
MANATAALDTGATASAPSLGRHFGRRNASLADCFDIEYVASASASARCSAADRAGAVGAAAAAFFLPKSPRAAFPAFAAVSAAALAPLGTSKLNPAPIGPLGVGRMSSIATAASLTCGVCGRSNAANNAAHPADAQSNGCACFGSDPDSDSIPNPHASAHVPPVLYPPHCDTSTSARRMRLSPAAFAAFIAIARSFSRSSTSAACAPATGSAAHPASRNRIKTFTFDALSSSASAPSSPSPPTGSSIVRGFGGGAARSAAHAGAVATAAATPRHSNDNAFARAVTASARVSTCTHASNRSAARSGHAAPVGSSPVALVAAPRAIPPSPSDAAPRHRASSVAPPPLANNRGNTGWHPSSAGPISSATAFSAEICTRGDGGGWSSAPEHAPTTRRQSDCANRAPSLYAPVASEPYGATPTRASSAVARERQRPIAAIAAARAASGTKNRPATAAAGLVASESSFAGGAGPAASPPLT